MSFFYLYKPILFIYRIGIMNVNFSMFQNTVWFFLYTRIKGVPVRTYDVKMK